MPGPTNRKVNVSDLKRAKKALKKQLRKERNRQKEIDKLRKENSDLSFDLMRMRDGRNNTGECC